MRSTIQTAAVAVLFTFLGAGCGKKAEAPAPEKAAAPAAAAGAEEKVLNVYNWSDYIDPKVIEDFQAETGIKVRYDVVVPSAYFLERQIKAGVFRKLDKAKLPNLANLDPDLMQRAAGHDPGNEYGVVYMWGTTGIGYDATKVDKLLPNAPVDSWSFIFDPAVISKLKGCGVSVLEDPTDMIATALLYLGKDPNSQSEADLKLAEDLLVSIRPYIRSISSSQYIDGLANGDICVAVGYSGDMLQARDRAVEAGKPVNIKYSIPKEGALMWFDTLAVPADAKHPDNAHVFINYLMRPEVAAKNSDFVNYANANAKATALVNEELRNDPGIYPTPEVKARLQANLTKSAEFTRLLNRAWTRFTTGR